MSNSVKKTIYLDHAAATPLDQSVYEAMQPHLQENFGNPSSIHHIGRAAFDTLQAAHESLANSLAVAPEEIILTGSGTESDNLAIVGLARAYQQHGNHVIISAIEHKAILKPAALLEREGFSVTCLPVDTFGRVSLTELEKALTTNTTLVSIMYANNEIGTIQPISQIAALLEEKYKGRRKPLFHTDACQAAGLLPVKPDNLGVDAMTINSSKIYGPKGIGLLYVRGGTKIVPMVIGGHQENGRRAGTENIALAVGFATALKKAIAEADTTTYRLTALRNHFLSKLYQHIPSLVLNGHPEHRLANNIHICIPDVEGEAILLMLDHVGICAATGSACNATDLTPSHVLTAIGRDDAIIHGSLRFTLGKNTTETDLDFTAEALGNVVHTLRNISATAILSSLTYVKHS